MYKGIFGGWDRFVRCGEVEMNGLVGSEECTKWIEDVEETVECMRGGRDRDPSDLLLMV